MTEQPTDQTAIQPILQPIHQPPTRTFNHALFWGLCVLALSVFLGTWLAQGREQWHMIRNMPVHSTFSTDEPREFMPLWQVAALLGMSWEEVEALVATGELAGTYTVIQLEYADPWLTIDPESPFWMETEHYIFSRERLYEWLTARIG